MAADGDVIAQTQDPEGRDVVLLRRIWDIKLAAHARNLPSTETRSWPPWRHPTIARMIREMTGSGTTDVTSALRAGLSWS